MGVWLPLGGERVPRAGGIALLALLAMRAAELHLRRGREEDFSCSLAGTPVPGIRAFAEELARVAIGFWRIDILSG